MKRSVVLLGLVIASGVAHTQPSPKRDAPDPIVARVIQVQIHGDAIVVRFNRGSQDGIARTWIAGFVDGNDAPAPGGECTLIRVDRDHGLCKSTLTLEQVKRLRLRLRVA